MRGKVSLFRGIQIACVLVQSTYYMYVSTYGVPPLPLPSSLPQDEAVRVVMYENQQWLPVASLFGLVGCPILRELKAKVLLTLACFAKSPDIATTMTHTLESVQVRRGGRGTAGKGRQSGEQSGTCT